MFIMRNGTCKDYKDNVLKLAVKKSQKLFFIAFKLAVVKRKLFWLSCKRINELCRRQFRVIKKLNIVD